MTFCCGRRQERVVRMVPTPAPGQIARVRQRLYLVADRVMPTQPGDSPLVRLSCVHDDNQGQARDVLWERELAPEVCTGEVWEAIATRGFDAPHRFAASLHTLRWHGVTATDPRLFQAPFRARIRLEASQLAPLRKALLLPRVNLRTHCTDIAQLLTNVPGCILARLPQTQAGERGEENRDECSNARYKSLSSYRTASA